MKKLTLLLAVLMVFLAFAGCSHSNSKEVPTGDPGHSSIGEEDQNNAFETDENGYLLDNLPELDFDNRVVNILHWKEGICVEFDAERNGQIVDNAVYNRNERVQDRLNVALQFTPIEGNNSNMENYLTAARADNMGDKAYDIYACYSMVGANLAIENLSQNLLDSNGAGKYLDFNKPWWPENLIGDATINNNLYFCSGDISSNLIYYMFVLFFNRTMAASYQLEDLYALVRDGNWTVSKMIEITADIYTDTNDNGRDENDIYGVVGSGAWCDGFFYGAGLNTVVKDDAGYLKRSESWGGERAINLLETLATYFHTGAGYIDSKLATNIFKKRNALMVLDSAGSAMTTWYNGDIDFGVLPFPKYNDAQDSYYTVIGFTYSMYCIAKGTSSPEQISAVLEADASESYRTVTPALFDEAFKYRYATNNDNLEMWDTIRSGIVFDLGRVFTTQLSKLSYSIFRNALLNNDVDEWGSKFNGQTDTIDGALTDIMLNFS